jgi:hypothetical protein
MVGGGATLQLFATLQRWPGALHLAALLRRWSTTHCSLQRSSGAAAATRWMLQRCCNGQQRVGPCGVAAMADSALDLAACYYDGRQRVGPRNVLLRCPAARWASERCYDVRQRYNFGQRSTAAFLFFFFFFFARQLEERKRMGERKKF